MVKDQGERPENNIVGGDTGTLVAAKDGAVADGLTPSTSKMAREGSRYRLRGLDGLRALAALGVLAYHVTPDWMPGGFMGVDVFFVLSGFLITSILIREKRLSGKIHVWRFWLRRVRRLFPAVALTVLVTVPVAAVINRDFLVGITRQVVGSLTFSFNWVNVIFRQSYFDRANPQFLSNMWTLSVEQQFYVLWPLLLLLIFLCPSRHRWVFPAVLAGFSVAEMAVLQAFHLDLTRIYQGTDSHSFGLMLGAMLALFFPMALENTPHYLDQFTTRARGIAAWLGIVGIAASFLTINDSDGFTYPWGVLAVSCLTLGVIQTCMEEVAGVSGPGRVLVNLLSWRPLVWLGLRSYSLYLWHWPIFVIVTALIPRVPQGLLLVIIALVSSLAAHLSYTFVEEPMRRHGIIASWSAWVQRWFGFRGFKHGLLAGLVAVIVVVPLCFAVVFAPSKTGAAILVEQGKSFLKKHNKPLATPGGSVQAPPRSPNPSQHPSGSVGKKPSQTPNKPGQKPATSATPEPSSPQTPPAGEAPATVDGSQVDVIGDSVTLASVPKLVAKMPGINVNAEVSRSSIAGTSIMRAMRDQGKLRPFLVFSLATNSTFRIQDGEQFMKELPANTRVVFVTGYGKSAQQWIQISNNTMRTLAGEYPERVKVANWDTAIAPHPELLASDSVHPQPQGQEIYAQAIYDALQQFLK